MAKEISDSKAAENIAVSDAAASDSPASVRSDSPAEVSSDSPTTCSDSPAEVSSDSPASACSDPAASSDFNQVPMANRTHIAFFGKRNAGKSSLVNAVTGQALSIVSDIKGTTTDPVQKAMELLPLGPVVIIDTPGIDDDGTVGSLRVEKTFEILRKTDAAVLVIDAAAGPADEDRKLIDLFRKRKVPFLIALNKSDLCAAEPRSVHTVQLSSDPSDFEEAISVSALTGEGIKTLKEAIGRIASSKEPEKYILRDKLQPADIVVLVTPIDSSAPKGRLILPQVQTIRDILDGHAVCMVTQTDQLAQALSALSKPPKLVVTDSQDFKQVKNIISPETRLTSFSILMARFKGILDTAAYGAHYLQNLTNGDKILICEGCTHHRQCEDIGTVKLTGWIRQYTGKTLDFHFTSGGQFPENPKELQSYALIVHCGGCMLNRREMQSRMERAQTAGVPFTNYGTLIAHINGILDRSLEIIYE
ncbi:MAG: [FeFe] hydrogenase H-cluster maturation GTPase HydF [Emergencia sp.]|nr:[FeFe] hydrogenase H-cluster maturation GTPase HydF [Emergencia sp.]